ncbi:SDR family NAD(P)-dependent oxidoreductase [Streptomyces sp. NPDC056663]|uniref:SDR family NAD(P)-dependent oxidoreductase n=1 Tax=Streptomyces sp. NPDC056663 TaxID=3345899 RepID=UPI003699D764
MHDYTGATALVTGASKGIGEALACDLATRGAHLVLVSRSADPLDELATRLRARHDIRVEVIASDLSDRQAPQTIDNTLTDRGLEVDLLINNAGVGPVGPFLTRPFQPILQAVDLNINAVMGLTRQIGPGMLERGRGGIINVASVAGFQPMPYQASYGAMKAFVLSFTEALAEELRGSGVRVMGAHPGPVATGFFEGTTAAVTAKAVTPTRIAANILDDFARGRSASFPGQLSDRANVFASRILPRTTVSRIVGNLNRRNGYNHATDIAPPAG